MSNHIIIPAAYFLDIETVPQYQHYTQAPEWLLTSFFKKYQEALDLEIGRMPKYPDANELDNIYQKCWLSKAALFSEFAKIVCISVGKIVAGENGPILRVKSVTSRHEDEVLKTFCTMISKADLLCAHNGKEFDFPFLFRRMLINNLPVPNILNPVGKKTWDLQLEDTVEMWSGTQWKYRVSLDTLTQLFGLESPKKDMDGSMVAEVYYSMFDGVANGELPFEKEQATLKRIATYCNGDILALANVYCKMKGYDLVKTENVVYA